MAAQAGSYSQRKLSEAVNNVQGQFDGIAGGIARLIREIEALKEENAALREQSNESSFSTSFRRSQSRRRRGFLECFEPGSSDVRVVVSKAPSASFLTLKGKEVGQLMQRMDCTPSLLTLKYKQPQRN